MCLVSVGMLYKIVKMITIYFIVWNVMYLIVNGLIRYKITNYKYMNSNNELLCIIKKIIICDLGRDINI